MIFIAGCHRSGTTWVRTLFEGLLGVTMAGIYECDLYQQIVGPFAAGLTGDAAWRRVITGYDGFVAHYNDTGLFGERDTFIERVGRARGSKGDSDVQRALDLIKVLYRDYCRDNGLSHDSILVDKSPNHLLYAELVLRQFPQSRMIEVVRDGRDVCVSAKRRFPGQASTLQHIRKWLQFIAAGERVRARPDLSARLHRVRYEDLKTDFTATVEELFRFAGIDLSEDQFARVAARASLESMRRTHPWNVWQGKTGAWKKHLSTQEQDAFESVAGGELRRLGYD